MLRRLPDRALHPRRRRAAGRRLFRRGSWDRLLILCHGNICRSPYAAARLRALLAEAGRRAPVVDSAGFIGPDRRSPPLARAVARERGLDLGGHLSALVTTTRLEEADLILVMSPAQRRALRGKFGQPSGKLLVLGDFDPEPIDTRVIRDPIEKGREAFEQAFTRIDRCLEEVVRVLTSTGG
ncbi:MAG: low molecular weight phosphotyrosine protein phosphatase [Gemmatimonadota bacterium]